MKLKRQGLVGKGQVYGMLKSGSHPVSKGKPLFKLECLWLRSGGHTRKGTGLRQEDKLEGYWIISPDYR